jgi:hypothetical protein
MSQTASATSNQGSFDAKTQEETTSVPISTAQDADVETWTNASEDCTDTSHNINDHT